MKTIKIERSKLQEKHKKDNPEIMYNLYEWNYGWLEIEKGNTLIILENGLQVAIYTEAIQKFSSNEPSQNSSE